MRKLGNREKILLVVFIFLIIFFIYFKYVIGPIRKEIDMVKGNVDKYKDKIQKLELTNKNNFSKKEELIKLKINFNNLMKELPQIEKNPEIAYRLKRLASLGNVKITNISFGEPEEYNVEANKNEPKDEKIRDLIDNYIKDSNNSKDKEDNMQNTSNGKIINVSVSVNIKGYYSNIVNFISYIENENRILSIDNVNFTQENNDESSVKKLENLQQINNDKNVNKINPALTIDNNTVDKQKINGIVDNSESYSNDDIIIEILEGGLAQNIEKISADNIMDKNNKIEINDVVKDSNNSQNTNNSQIISDEKLYVKKDDKILANINLRYFYINSDDKKNITYDFNKGNYGKDDIFR